MQDTQRHAHLRHLLAEHPLQPCAPSSCPCWLSQLCVPAQQLPPACGGHPHWLPFALPLHSPANQPSPLQEQRQALTLICRLQIGLPDNNQHVAVVLFQLGAAVGICMQMSRHKFIHGCDCGATVPICCSARIVQLSRQKLNTPSASSQPTLQMVYAQTVACMSAFRHPNANMKLCCMHANVHMPT